MKFKMVGAAALAAALSAIPASAHHSFVMFDGNRTVVLEGTVKEFLWTYPHAWIVVTANDAAGKPAQWALELPGPGNLARNGWVPKSLTPGMKISTIIHPLKNGQPGGSCVKVTLPDGKVLEV
jgi:hypothetical protein